MFRLFNFTYILCANQWKSPVPLENPHRHAENMYTAQRTAPSR